MALQIADSTQFQTALNSLTDELVDARIHLTLFTDLADAQEEFTREMNASWTFWSLTARAHIDVSMSHLCRAYDSHRGSLTLRNLLVLIKGNTHWFNEEMFRERIKTNPHVDSLAPVNRRPSLVQLDADIASVSEDDPLVTTLVAWRHKTQAHKSPAFALDPGAFSALYPLTYADMATLIDRGVAIVNRYSSLFRAITTLPSILGHKDYRKVLEAVREHLDAQKRRIEEEFRRLGEALPEGSTATSVSAPSGEAPLSPDEQ